MALLNNVSVFLFIPYSYSHTQALNFVYRSVKTLEEEVTLVGNNLRSLEVSEGEVSVKHLICEGNLY